MKYTQSKLDIINFDIEDVITTSSISPIPDDVLNHPQPPVKRQESDDEEELDV